MTDKTFNVTNHFDLLKLKSVLFISPFSENPRSSMLYSKYQEYYYIFLMLYENIHYLCNQKVEEEIGSAGEQPISNKLSALYSKPNTIVSKNSQKK